MEIGFCDSFYSARRVVVKDNYAYVTAGNSGLHIIDISNPFSPFEVSNFDTPESAYEIEIIGNYAYITHYKDNFLIVDISSPLAPFEINNINISYWSYNLVVEGNYLYSTNQIGNKMFIIDISDPSTPFEVGNYETPDWATGLAAIGKYVFVGGWNTGMFIIENELISGINENTDKINELQINIYPNPVSTEMVIKLLSSEPIGNIRTIEILNNRGQKADEIKFENNFSNEFEIKWDKGDLPAGIYFLVIKTENEQLSEKFIIL